MSLDKIQELVSSLTKKVEDNEKLATPVLAAKIAKHLQDNPYDQTLGAMCRVLDKMASNQNLFITRGEFKKLYSKLYSRNTKFAELFQNELGVSEAPATPAVYNRDDAKELNAYEVADPILANALNSVFDHTLPLKMYSEALANKARESVLSTLSAWNLKPTSIKVADGNDKFLVLQADYETPKGVTSFYVPVEINNNKVVEASVFMGNATPQDLNHVNIKSYLKTYAGTKLAMQGSVLLNALVKSASEDRSISDAELALIKLNSSREQNSAFFQNQVIGQKLATASVTDVELPKYDTFSSFEEQFDSAIGQAKWQHGDVVVTAMNHLARELVGFGYKNPQISIAKSDDSTIFYSVALDAGRVAFTVPVKVANKKLVKPTVMICNGSVSSFSKAGINELYTNNQTDYKAAAVASPQFNLKPSDLITSIREAVAEGNHAKAEDALNVLANAGDDKAYATGFQIFLQGLSGKQVKAQSGCTMQIKTANSVHMVCGHTGLPLHKVYQDKNGNCCPSYRQNMNETYEGASFMNAKIFG
jgi:hypothetical protein